MPKICNLWLFHRLIICSKYKPFDIILTKIQRCATQFSTIIKYCDPKIKINYYGANSNQKYSFFRVCFTN